MRPMLVCAFVALGLCACSTGGPRPSAPTEPAPGFRPGFRVVTDHIPPGARFVTQFEDRADGDLISRSQAETYARSLIKRAQALLPQQAAGHYVLVLHSPTEDAIDETWRISLADAGAGELHLTRRAPRVLGLLFQVQATVEPRPVIHLHTQQPVRHAILAEVNLAMSAGDLALPLATRVYAKLPELLELAASQGASAVFLRSSAAQDYHRIPIPGAPTALRLAKKQPVLEAYFLTPLP